MKSRTRLAALLVALLGALVCVLVGTADAQAAPYSASPALSVGVTNPCQQDTLVVHGTGYQPGTVAIRVGGRVVARVRVGPHGNFNVPITLPAGLVGRVVLIGDGGPAADTASAVLTIDASCTAGGNGHGPGSASPTGNAADPGSNGAGSNGVSSFDGGGGGLSSTGVAVAAFLLLALALVGGGTGLLVGARRRAAQTS